MTNDRSPLLPDRHQPDLFVADIIDAVPKGDLASMEHPVFSLSTKPDMRPRRYERGDSWLEVTPSKAGLATVHDRDLLIYCISQLMAALNEGKPVSRRLRFRAYDLLVATNRQTSGRGYELLKDAMRRLQGTQIETNIKNGGREYFKVFGLIDSAEIVRETRDGRMQDVEIVLSDWIFDAIQNNSVLTISRRYFQLRKPLERRLYELARKHCGGQPEWRISLETLRDKCGSGSTSKEFRRLVGKILEDDEAHDHMPDYRFELIEDMVFVRPKKAAEEPPAPAPSPAQVSLRLDPDTYGKARREAPGWDVHVLEQDWRSWLANKAIEVKNPDSHFLAFCRARGPYK